MPTDTLFAFLDGRLAGRFEDKGDTVCFTPAPGAPRLSLSLPAVEPSNDAHALRWLENLLPENGTVRARMAHDAGCEDSVFELLAAYGEDLAGAVSLSPDETLPERDPAPIVEATSDDIAFQVARMSKDVGAVVQVPGVRQRLSLAGAQAKFSLSRVADRWFWSTYELPSTHILKPPPERWRAIAQLETASLELARSLKIESSHSTTVQFAGQDTYITERWDRLDGRRLHAEDLGQAIGLPPSSKYSITAATAAAFLHEHGLTKPFLRQLAFNVALGNADAHVKNYSLLLSGDQVRLAPLYDTVPTLVYPRLDTTLAMRIGDARHLAAVGHTAWHSMAREARMDPRQVLDIVTPIIRAVAERLPDLVKDAGLDQNAVTLAVKHSRKLVQSTATPAQGVASTNRPRRSATAPMNTQRPHHPPAPANPEPNRGPDL